MPSALKVNKEEEKMIKEVLYLNARDLCRKDIDAYVECSKHRTFTVITACRPFYDAMNNCVKQYTRPEDLEELITRYLKNKEEKTKQDIENAKAKLHSHDNTNLS